MSLDFSIEKHGNLAFVRLHTIEARLWVAENVDNEAQFWNGALVVEPRYVLDLVVGMNDAGLRCA